MDVSVDVSHTELHEVVDTSRDEIDRLATEAGKEDRLPLFGFYTAVIVYEIHLKSRVQHLESGSFCSIPIAAKIIIKLNHRVIHLAKETKTDSCLYDAAREHAWLHALADERALSEKSIALSATLRAVLPYLPLSTAVSEQAAESQTAALVTTEIERELSSVDEFRAKLNNSVDSPSELARLHSKCSTSEDQL